MSLIASFTSSSRVVMWLRVFICYRVIVWIVFSALVGFLNSNAFAWSIVHNYWQVFEGTLISFHWTGHFFEIQENLFRVIWSFHGCVIFICAYSKGVLLLEMGIQSWLYTRALMLLCVHTVHVQLYTPVCIYFSLSKTLLDVERHIHVNFTSYILPVLFSLKFFRNHK